MSDKELIVNQEFDNFETVKTKIHEYGEKSGFTFITGHSQSSLKPTDDHPVSSISFTCEKFGKPRFRGTGIRKTQSKKCDCPVSIRLTLSDEKYKITYVHLQHNHEINQDSNTFEKTSEPAISKKKTTMPNVESVQNAIARKDKSQSISAFQDTGEEMPLNDSTVRNLDEEAVALSQPKNITVDEQSQIENLQNNHRSDTSDSNPQQNDYLKMSYDDKKKSSDLIKQCEHAINELHEIQKNGGLLDLKDLEKLNNSLSTLINLNTAKLSNIKLVQTKSKGRPKGTQLNAIGLRHKKMKKQFEKRTQGQQLMTMIDWFMFASGQKANIIDKEYRLTKNDVNEKGTIKTMQHFLDDIVDLKLLETYMEEDAYSYFVSLVIEKKKKDEYICGICNSQFCDKSIQCESCLIWFEYKCINLEEAPSGSWFCQNCIDMFSEHIDKYE